MTAQQNYIKIVMDNLYAEAQRLTRLVNHLDDERRTHVQADGRYLASKEYGLNMSRCCKYRKQIAALSDAIFALSNVKEIYSR